MEVLGRTGMICGAVHDQTGPVDTIQNIPFFVCVERINEQHELLERRQGNELKSLTSSTSV